MALAGASVGAGSAHAGPGVSDGDAQSCVASYASRPSLTGAPEWQTSKLKQFDAVFTAVCGSIRLDQQVRVKGECLRLVYWVWPKKETVSGDWTSGFSMKQCDKGVPVSKSVVYELRPKPRQRG